MDLCFSKKLFKTVDKLKDKYEQVNYIYIKLRNVFKIFVCRAIVAMVSTAHTYVVGVECFHAEARDSIKDSSL